MLNQELIKVKIERYIKADYQWHQEKEGSLEEGIGKQMSDLEQEILTSFGLPFMAQQFSDLMQAEGFSNIDIEKRATTLFNTLKTEAEAYLLSPIEKDTVLLLKARSHFRDATEILPLIDIAPTAYNCFLYYDIFLRGIYDENEILEALKRTEILEYDNSTRIPCSYKEILENEIYNPVWLDLPLWEDYKMYLNYKESIHSWDIHDGNQDLDQYVSLPTILELDHFIIKHIYLKDENNCCITILLEFNITIIELTIWCTANMMRAIMLHAKYYSIAIPPLYVTSPKFLNEGIVNIPISEAIGKNIEIEKIKLELERLDEEDDEIQNPFAYVIINFIPRENLPTIKFEEPDDWFPF
jgi:hypothetical protein